MSKIDFINVFKQYGDVVGVRELNLKISDHEFICLLGPSGCGKSTSLRMLAGLENVTSGQIMLDDRRIDDVPARDRDMSMVFENYALYPHLTAFDNIATPLRVRSVPVSEITKRVTEIAKMLKIEHLLSSYPAKLSGGEKQRVSIGRAIVRHPKVFLMDEPLGHLEAYMRVNLRSEIRRLHDRLETTTVFVTHDQEEAAAVADRIAVMRAGRLQQIGTLDQLLDGPVNRFVAEFIGEIPINMFEATLISAPTGRELSFQGICIKPDPRHLAALEGSTPNTSLTIGIRPWDVQLSNEEGSAIRGTVSLVEPQGDAALVFADTIIGPLTALTSSEGAPAPGERVGFHLPSARLQLFATSGDNVLLRAA